MGLNIRHLQCAVEIGQTGNLSRAAEHMHLTQSALTQGIAVLERQLGSLLFMRSNAGMQVTAEGRIFLARVQRALQYLRDAAYWWFAQQSARQDLFIRNLSWRQLQALTWLVQLGSYTAAARQLGLTQPTLHRTIKDLQTLCGESLFNRSPAGVDIPWRTRQLSRYAGLFFAEIEQGIEELALAENGAQGQLKIGCLPLAQTRIVPAAILQLLAMYPAAALSVVDGPYEEQLQALLHGQLDIIVGALRQPAPSNDIVQHSLFSDELSVVVRSGHPLAGQASITLAQLQQLPWIAPRKSTPARAVFEQLFADEQLSPPTNIIECSSLVVSRGILLASERLGLLPAKQVEVELQAGLLQLCPVTLAGTARAIGYSVRKNWQPTRIQAQFITLLKQLT